MGLKATFVTEWAKIKKLPRKYTIPGAIFAIFLLFYAAIFLISKPVTFSYAEKTCVRQLTLFPDIHKESSKDAGYSVEFTQRLKIGNFSAMSTSACFVPEKAPSEGSFAVSTAPFGGLFMRKSFNVKVGTPPVVNVDVFNKPLPSFKPLVIPLSDTDQVFSYLMKANGTEVKCLSKEKATSCDVQQLKLAQDAPYKVEIVREFKNQHIASVVKKDVNTLPATHVVDSSIKQGETVFSKPTTIDISFDKKVAKMKPTLYRIEGDKRIPVPTTLVIKGMAVQLTMEELPRLADFVLEASGVEATDGSGLEAPYQLSFKTSGGPKVVKMSVGTISVPLGATAVITFDQPLSEKQDTSKIITTAGGAVIATKKANQVFISLAGVPKCGNFSVKITDELLSSYDIKGGSAWTFSGRMICHTIGTIGYSSRGKPINAYYFGNGGSTVLYTGAIHGNEYSSSYILKDWINELEAKAGEIPAGRQIVVVPTLNPDGFASGTRNSAKNINLNRNFDVSDWKSDINDTGGTVQGGGGPNPMSEPETQAIANLSRQLRPRLVLSYHAVGSVAIGNQAGDSARLAAQYASMVGYRNGTGSSSEVFDYEITGTYDDWLAEKMGVPSMVIELGSYTFRDFGHHRAAFWAMAKS